MVHRPNDRVVVRCEETEHTNVHSAKWLQTHITLANKKVAKKRREKIQEHNIPIMLQQLVFVSNKAHWYMLPIKSLCPQYYTANVCQLARYCSVTHPDYISF